MVFCITVEEKKSLANNDNQFLWEKNIKHIKTSRRHDFNDGKLITPCNVHWVHKA